ncbi:hypothetical protein ACFC1T_09400 [Kitasatospora sp. NPDC056076]|uniref:hypothetical protein n=1 Tax=Kitasatospora sp. NPDC056076 TaxID=3345703 RepID=UPI0035E2317B
MPKPKKPFVPTRREPHRWCSLLHRISGAAAMVMWGPILLQGFAALLFVVAIAVGFVVLVYLRKLIHARPNQRRGQIDLLIKPIGEAEVPKLPSETTIARKGREPVDPALVHAGWARAAAVMDMVPLAGIPVAVSVLIPSGPNSVLDFPTGGLLGLVVGVAVVFIGSTSYAHHRATEPRRPRRVKGLVPQANGS